MFGNVRKSGILCHITSLPGDFGIGDLGKNAYYFVDFLKNTLQSYWQILPLGHVGQSASPYQSHSAFAGNPYLIDLESLIEEGFLFEDDFYNMPEFNPNLINFELLFSWKMNLLKKSVVKFIEKGLNNAEDFKCFCKKEAWWLEDYALFMALKDKHCGKPWNKWKKNISNRNKSAIAKAKKDLSNELLEYKIIQFFFFTQWLKLKNYANNAGIQIIGDLPIFVDFDSDCVWANPHLFLLDENNNPDYVTGVPPDYFCEDGQYWGNPLYNWDVIKSEKYLFWENRFKQTFAMVDVVRLDHFRAFAEAWKIKANKAFSARKGKWMHGPGKDFFDFMKSKIKEFNIIAEDLGIIDKKVTDLRDQCGFPGMAVLEFAFDEGDSLFLPHNLIKNQVAYVGTHDNNTAIGWWSEIPEEIKNYVCRYFSVDGNNINWDMIRNIAKSVSNTAVYTIQDIIGLDGNARMNFPGTSAGNWNFRFQWSMINDFHTNMLREITLLYKRNPK